MNLNTTGSFWLDNEGNYWSYNTQLTCNYNGYRLVNNTFYSMTTRKHQSQINKTLSDILIDVNHYGYMQPVKDLQANLKSQQGKLIELEHSRNSKYKQLKIDNCKQQIALIQRALAKDLMGVA